MDGPPRRTPCHDAILLDNGPPAHYRLRTERKYIDGTEKKVRQWIYGRRDSDKHNKVILMVGETGSGKTTMINTMVNYILGVKFRDEEFYQITQETENKDQSHSQTREITVYEVFVEENPISLTIIDTPGYGDTEGYEKDEEICKNLLKLFLDENGICYIDAACFVMKASQNRLSGKEFYIFHSVLSLFGRDMENNIVFLLTQSDGIPPEDALNAIKTAEIPCRRDKDNEPVFFLFNNQQKKIRSQSLMRTLKFAWEIGEESMNELLTLLDEKNRKSVDLTLDVLKERIQLEACVSSLVDQISESELKTTELKQIDEAIKQNKDKIKKCENFEFKVERVRKIQVNTYFNRRVTSCNKCEENCHAWNCWWANEAKDCYVMKEGKCTVCKNKCKSDEHKRENTKYVTETEKVTMTFDQLKKEYKDNKENVKNFDTKLFENTEKEHENITNKLKNDQEKIKIEKSKMLTDAYLTIMSLSKIALKSDSALTLQHLDFLIPRLKEEGKDELMKNLEDLKKAGEAEKNKSALQHLLAYGRQKWNKYF